MKRFYILAAIIGLFVLAFALPAIKSNGLNRLSDQDKIAAMNVLDRRLSEIFDNPIERLLMLKTTVREVKGRASCPVVVIDGYTFFGLRSSSAEFRCDGSERLQW